jgi:hypothetical protein
VKEIPDVLTVRPVDVPVDLWDSIPEGFRLRWLKRSQFAHALSFDQYYALARLPYWMFYGPEHGAPADWYNDQGYLLPKYRPGGGRHDEFRRWRHEYRRSSWRRRSLRGKTERFFAQFGMFTYVAWVLTCLLISSLFARVVAPRQALISYEGVKWLSYFVFLIIGLFGLRLLHRLAPDILPWWRLDD